MRLPRSLCLALVLAVASAAPGVVLAQAMNVLVFSKTAGFRHDSIPAGIATVQLLGKRYGFAVEATEQGSAFSNANLDRFDCVVWLNTTGDVLDAVQQSAFSAYITAGGGFVGVHSAADTEYDWPFYGQLFGNGAWFLSHPPIQDATLVRESTTHPAALPFPPTLLFNDEWYNFRMNPRAATDVLLRLDESSYSPGNGAMGADHPIAWSHAVGSGRAFYTGLGHRTQTYANAIFREHLAAGIFWSAQRPFDVVFADGFDQAR